MNNHRGNQPESSEKLSPDQLSPVWVVVPAAGIGARIAGDRPKQYMPLGGKTILQITLEKMLSLPRLAGVLVAVSKEDVYWPDQGFSENEGIHRVDGGAERADSVLNALEYLQALGVHPDHWILVHDAARPCVRLDMITRLRQQIEQGNSGGGILAKPVADTVKRVEEGTIQSTLDRSSLWQAHTPQMFRLRELRQALLNAREHGFPVTDEASAMERQGARPQVVEDRRDNIKVTHPEDLPLAEMILRQQAEEQKQ